MANLRSGIIVLMITAVWAMLRLGIRGYKMACYAYIHLEGRKPVFSKDESRRSAQILDLGILFGCLTAIAGEILRIEQGAWMAVLLIISVFFFLASRAVLCGKEFHCLALMAGTAFGIIVLIIMLECLIAGGLIIGRELSVVGGMKQLKISVCELLFMAGYLTAEHTEFIWIITLMFSGLYICYMIMVPNYQMSDLKGSLWTTEILMAFFLVLLYLNSDWLICEIVKEKVTMLNSVYNVWGIQKNAEHYVRDQLQNLWYQLVVFITVPYMIQAGIIRGFLVFRERRVKLKEQQILKTIEKRFAVDKRVSVRHVKAFYYNLGSERSLKYFLGNLRKDTAWEQKAEFIPSEWQSEGASDPPPVEGEGTEGPEMTDNRN